MARKDADADNGNDDRPRRRCCYFCEEEGKAKSYSFWVGTEVYRKETALGGNTIQVKAKYRDMQKHSIRVCTDCATKMWRWKHLFGVIGWGVLLALSIMAAVIMVVLMRPPNLWYALATAGMIGVPTGLLWVMDVWELAIPSLKVATMEYLVLDRVKPEYEEDGDSFFTHTEYRVMFLHEPPP